MDASGAVHDPVEQAREAMRSYLLAALEKRFLGLHTEDILCAAESVWNNYEPGEDPPPFEESSADVSSPVFQELVRVLHRLRATRFGHARFFIFAMDHEYEESDLLFTGDLMWPHDVRIHRFEMRVSRHALSPPEWN